MSDDCARAILRLREELSGQWPRRIFYSGAENISVLSLSAELTVWCMDGEFIWDDGTGVVRYPLRDVGRAAEHLLERVATDGGTASGPASGPASGGAFGSAGGSGGDTTVRALQRPAARHGHDGGQPGQSPARPQSIGA